MKSVKTSPTLICHQREKYKKRGQLVFIVRASALKWLQGFGEYLTLHVDGNCQFHSAGAYKTLEDAQKQVRRMRRLFKKEQEQQKA